MLRNTDAGSVYSLSHALTLVTTRRHRGRWRKRMPEPRGCNIECAMPRSLLALASVMAVLALALADEVTAKDSGPVRVVSESGKVGWIRGASATAWWAGLESAQQRSCVCNSADTAAKFASRLMGRARWTSHQDGDWPTGVMLIQSGHSAPWLYYPASRTTPPYLVSPATLGVDPFRWDNWRVVTPRMQRIITAALAKRTVSTYRGPSSGFPTGRAVGGGIGVLLVVLTLVAWRRRLAQQVRGSRSSGLTVSPR